MGIKGSEDHSVRELCGVGVAVWANCGVGGCRLGGLQCGEL